MVYIVEAKNFQNPGTAVPLGNQGENKVRGVVFDITDFVEELGSDGTVKVKVQRPGEGLPYDAELVDEYDEGDVERYKILWTLTDTDTGVTGKGRCQLTYTVDDPESQSDPIVKTIVVSTEVLPSLGVSAPSPNPSSDIVARINEAVIKCEADKEVAVAKASDAEAYGAGTRGGEPVASDDPAYQNNAAYYEGVASSAATSAASDASDSEAYAVGTRGGEPVESTDPAYHHNSKYYADYVDETIDEFARVDGYYEGMTAGNAEQLISTVYVEDSDPYIRRTAGGSADISNRKYEEFVGGSVSWNQIVDNSQTAHTYTVSSGRTYNVSTNGVGPVSGRKYFMSVTVEEDTTSEGLRVQYGNNSFTLGQGAGRKYRLLNGNPSEVNYIYSFISSSESETATLKTKADWQCFDLTLMFGSSIADYIYQLEQNTAGSGVAFFKKLFPKTYYPYNAGEAISVKTSGVKTTGLNQWDEDWEQGRYDDSGAKVASTTAIRSKNFIKVFPSTTYYFESSEENLGRLCFYDIDQNFIETKASASDAEFTTPSNCYFINLSTSTEYGGTYKNDICINLAWSGYRNGEYEEYDEHNYNVSNIDLRGVIKKDAAGNLYYDGDIYKSDGTVIRKYGIVDLGTLTWLYQAVSETYPYGYFISSTTVVKAATTNMVCQKYVWKSGELTDKTFNATGSGNLRIIDSAYTDAATFKTAMSGVYLVYELAVPTEESADPYALSMTVDDFGTEEFIDERTVPVPVGHNTKYPDNLRDKLQHLPHMADADGEYTVLQTGSTMTLKPFDQSMKANIDGLYEDMTVGNAEQLVATTFETDKIPYNFRTSGGSLEIGDREEDEIHGGSVSWNQLVTGARESGSVFGLTVTSVSDYVSTFVGTMSDTSQFRISRNNDISFISGHKYFVGLGEVMPNDARIYFGSAVVGSIASMSAAVFACDSSPVGSLDLKLDSGTEVNLKITLSLFDLTLMFGSQIADYIYSLEQATAGAGVAYFRKLFPKPYYAYDAGGLKSVKTSAHRMTGFNQWNHETDVVGSINSSGVLVPSSTNYKTSDYIKVLPNTVYFFKDLPGSYYSLAGAWYDADKNFIRTMSAGSQSYALSFTRTSPENAAYVRATYTIGYGEESCVNLHWDGERDGEYEPYKLTEYALDPDLELRGVFKLDANNSLYCDGDIYKSDGTVRRRYGIVDLGTLDWAYDSVSAYFKSLVSDIKELPSLVCARYAYLGRGASAAILSGPDKSIYYYDGGYIRIKDTAYTDAATFKTAMSGVYMVYELAEETEETAQPYQNPQIVDDFGTEEYVDTRDVAIPVGHSTEYMPNLRAKVESAPDSPDSNGDYILRRANGANTYVPLVIPTELPSAPSSDGTYTLSVTISDGTATYSWVSN